MLSSAATATATATSVSARSGEILCSYLRRKTVAPFRFAQSVYCKSLRPSFVTVRAMTESQTAPRSQPQSSGFSGKKQALISLSDKRDLATLGNGLQELGYTIFSTGGTASTLENAGVSVTKVETLTHFPEMLDGRVKTLHPSIHGGILARRDMEHHMEALNKHRIGTFDVVVVNLYPFYDKVTAPGGISFEDGIENINIGGPAMIRAAAKNHKDILIVVDSEDYQAVLEYLKGGQSDQQFRRKLAWKAFQHVAAYDSAVSEWLWKQTEGKEKFPPSFTVPLSLKSSLRYGENPHQKAAFYVDKSLGEVNAGGIATAIQHHGKLMQSRAWLRLRSYYRGTTVFPISDHVRSEQPSDLVRWVCSSSYPGNLKPRREGYISNPNVARPEWLISRLCKEGRIAEARKLFDGLPERDVITWTDVITGYIKLGNMREARELFDRGDSKKNVVTWTAMVSGYLRSKQFSAAEMLFQEMPERNIVSWNTMIDGYAQSGRIDKALELFDEMPEKNTVSWNTIIKALVMRGRIEEAMSLFEKMPIRDVISWTAMVDGLAKNGKVDEARWVFDCMPERNIVSWNAMITGYAHNNRIDEADKLFQVMPERDFASWNTMITGFIRNGEINKACILFDRMPEKNVISWTTMITGYVQNKENEDALKIFSNMLTDGSVKPNVGTYVSILSACSDLAGLVEGQQIHQLISKSVHQENELVTSALINMYSKSGKLVAAKKIFDYGLESQRDLISWNSMIVVYAHHGRGKEAIEMYEQMRKHEFKPNEVTYLNLLSACSHAGLVEKGMEFFEELVKDKSLSLREDHYTCLVDLCGRAGRLKDVLEFINSDEAKPSGSVYGALLSACNVHGELSIAKEVVKKVLETGSDDAGTYVMMSNMYKRSGKGEEAAEMRMKMKERGLKKQPGCSWIAIGNKRHAFVVGDLSHPRFEALDSVVSDLNYKMRKNKNMTSEAEEDEFLVI